jgi:hypothetical protein
MDAALIQAGHIAKQLRKVQLGSSAWLRSSGACMRSAQCHTQYAAGWGRS